MSLSSLYLTNQWIYTNPRKDERLRKGDFFYFDQKHFKNSASLEDKLLQTMGRIVHSDYFETNARPYQAFTLHSLFNLYAFAENETIRAAAKNAIDFTATKFAFQSFEGKRLVPQRRQSAHRNSMSMYENDATSFMMGILSGFYAWSDTIDISTGKLNTTSYFPAQYSGNAFGHMLWAALFADDDLLGSRAYSIPRPIHSFMLRKQGGFWARMQARFGDGNYRAGHWPRYFEDGRTARRPRRGSPGISSLRRSSTMAQIGSSVWRGGSSTTIPWTRLMIHFCTISLASRRISCRRGQFGTGVKGRR
jgi:hypothetical protein